MSSQVTVQFQSRWRLADEKGKSVAEGFTSVANAEQWAAEHGLTVVARPRQKGKPLPPTPGRI